MHCSMTGFPVLHHLPELAQIYVLWVSNVIELSHPMPPSCPPALNLSQHQVGCLVAQLLSPPDSSLHGILQARILEWVALLFSRKSSQPRDWAQDSCITDRFFTIWATRQVLTYLDSVLESRNSTSLTKGSIVKAMVFFSSSHVQMWEFDDKDDSVLKTSCFQTVMLEKTLESPLDSQGKQGDQNSQSWRKSVLNIGRTDAEAPIFWPHDAKSWLIEKDPAAGKDWGQKREGTAEGEMVRWHHCWADSGRYWKTEEAGVL